MAKTTGFPSTIQITTVVECCTLARLPIGTAGSRSQPLARLSHGLNFGRSEILNMPVLKPKL